MNEDVDKNDEVKKEGRERGEKIIVEERVADSVCENKRGMQERGRVGGSRVGREG